MIFIVQPCVPGDSQGLAAVMMGARFGDPHWVFLWQDPSLEDITVAAAERLPWNLISGRETTRHEKVIDVKTGEIVGYARWTLPSEWAKKNIWPEAQVAEPTPENCKLFEKKFQAVTDNGRIRGLKTDGSSAFRSRPLEVVDAKIMKDGPYLTLDYLTTAPAYQRNGVATMLVQSGLKVADENSMKAYVMASPAGFKVYQNNGFKLVETVSVDYRKYGGSEPMVHHFMVRDPVSPKP
ncbi:hypothetical protein V1523DRAFT_399773 [Lipomyces doorenjongii]